MTASICAGQDPADSVQGREDKRAIVGFVDRLENQRNAQWDAGFSDLYNMGHTGMVKT
jgi:hypothetical protein